MRPRYLKALLSLSLGPLLAVSSCDSVTTGQRGEDPNPPVLVKLLIQDEGPSGGRNKATDLLDKTPPVECSLRDPCPSGDKYSHPACNLSTGICPDPLKPSETPPALGVIQSYGGNMIRLVFDKVLDAASLENVTTNPMTGAITGYALKDPSIIGIYDASGKEISSLKYFDPNGAPDVTSDVFINPYGPALVIKPKRPMQPITKYSIRLKPEAFKDSAGQSAARDVNGDAIAMTYEFTTEAFCYAGGAVEDLANAATKENPTDGAIDAKDVLAIRSNAPFDPATIKVTIKKGGVAMTDVIAVPEYGTVPASCQSAASSPTQINVFRVSGVDRRDWDEGTDYTATVEVTSLDSSRAKFALDPFGKLPYQDVPFKVRKGIDVQKLYLAEDSLLPWECTLGGPPDGGAVVLDMATPPDMAIDMAAPTDDMAVAPDMAAPVDMGVGDDAGDDMGPVDGGVAD